ncbi:MAG: NADH-quinone oxidoreductase subunit H [Elusimicrobia bacterium]|nr:NADH-quinone oxidoreductase subunit H [Elusimicrobiota bacterium]
MEISLDPRSIAWAALAAAAAPLLPGVINKTKAFFAGRKGQPWLQSYHDLVKLLRKGAVYSRTTSWVFRAGPVLQLACAATALALVPMGGRPALVSFAGDFLVLAGLLALMRFAVVTAALDTGSSFEGMGASREAAFSALAEPALLLSFAALACGTGRLSLSEMLAGLSAGPAGVSGPVLSLVALALFGVLLAENSRMPVDDPNTHLELTMIHEVMVLDHGGPDLAYIEYASALKLWVLGAILSGVLLRGAPGGWAGAGAMLGLAVAVGVVESSLARLRLARVPQFLIGAGALSALALILSLG